MERLARLLSSTVSDAGRAVRPDEPARPLSAGELRATRVAGARVPVGSAVSDLLGYGSDRARISAHHAQAGNPRADGGRLLPVPEPASGAIRADSRLQPSAPDAVLRREMGFLELTISLQRHNLRGLI